MRNMMSRLKLTVNESKKSGLSTAGREVRFSQVQVWSLLLAEDGAGLLGHHSFQEASAAFV